MTEVADEPVSRAEFEALVKGFDELMARVSALQASLHLPAHPAHVTPVGPYEIRVTGARGRSTSIFDSYRVSRFPPLPTGD